MGHVNGAQMDGAMLALQELRLGSDSRDLRWEEGDERSVEVGIGQARDEEQFVE